MKKKKTTYAMRLVVVPKELRKVSAGIVAQPTEGEWFL